MFYKIRLLKNRLLGTLFFLGILWILLQILVTPNDLSEKIVGVYGVFIVSYFIGKKLLSLLYQPYTNPPMNKKVSIIMPFYNEDYHTLNDMLQSLLAQTYPIHELFIIDDGSTQKTNYKALLAFAKKYHQIPIIVHRYPKNKGKRWAQAWAFKRATGDIFFTVDSDGYIYPNALTELMRPFSDEEVMAVTGRISAKNKDLNFITKLLNMRYDHAFRIERAAQSITQNILVCSGPISCYRKHIITNNLDHYLSQTFLGHLVQSGDDRCLTNYAILKGKTVYQCNARCDTNVPTTLAQFLRQQIRWNKSFLRETLRTFIVGMKKPMVLIWVLFEVMVWILFGFVFLFSLCFHIQSFLFMLMTYYVASIFLTLYIKNSPYFLKNALISLTAPVFGILHLIILLPIRCYALVTIKKNNWETR
jgi:hyaluronan synthase